MSDDKINAVVTEVEYGNIRVKLDSKKLFQKKLLLEGTEN